MKLLELCTSSGVGGLELYAVKTAIRLKSSQHLIAAVAPNSLCHERLKDSGIPLSLIPRWSEKLPFLAIFRLAALIRREKVDVIHMHWGHDLLLAVLAIKLSRRSIKLVYTRQMLITRPKHDAYHRFLYRSVSTFITITEDLATQARRFLPLAPEQIKVLYYGVPAAKICTAEQRLLIRSQWPKIANTDFLVAMVGRITEAKGQHLLLEAIAQLRSLGHAISCVMIGPAFEDNYADRLEQRVTEEGLDNAIVFHGSHPDPVSILAAFDGLVMPSRHETFGLVLAEGMRAGLPVIGSEAGGVPEIIEAGKTGLLCQPEDADSLQQALLQWLTNADQRQAMAAAGKAFADRQYSLDTHYHQLQSLLMEDTNHAPG